MNSNFTNEQINEIVEKYKNGIIIDEIIASVNSEEHYVREVLKEKQLDRAYNTWTKELSSRVILLHQQGYLHKDICWHLLVSDVGINKTLDRNNIPRMDCSQRNRKFSRNSNYFDIIDTQEKAYFLGLISSDGCNFVPRKQITLVLQEEDGYLISKLKEELEYEGPIKIDTKRHEMNPLHKVAVRLVIQDIHLSERLAELGVIQNKSLTYKFPTAIPNDMLRHFIRGYFDGDGSVYYDEKRKKGRSSIVGTLDFCQNIQKILYSMNIKCNMYNPKQSQGKDTYIVQTGGTKSTYSFLNWLYEDSTVRMNRKYDIFVKIKNRYLELHAI